MNKTLTISAVVTLGLASGSAFAEHRYDTQRHYFTDKARVIHVEPVMRTIRVGTPQQECFQEEVRRPVVVEHRHSDGAAVVGGIIGGIIGHKLGHGRGGATIAGTLVGASIGKNSAQHQDHTEYYDDVSYENRCSTQVSYHTEERVEGYDVTYRYKGEEYTARMPYDPGKFIQVNISVAPAR